MLYSHEIVAYITNLINTAHLLLLNVLYVGTVVMRNFVSADVVLYTYACVTVFDTLHEFIRSGPHT